MTSGSRPQVDTHFHVIDFSKFTYPWPTAADEGLFRDYTIEEHEKDRDTTPVKYSVCVQLLDTHVGETDWLLETAKSHPSLKGIVAGIDLTNPNLRAQLLQLKETGQVVGFRNAMEMSVGKHDWLASDDVVNGLKTVEELGFTYDLLLRPHHLKYAIAVVRKLPRLKFVVNHIAKPLIKDKVMDGWKEEMAELAKCPNVYCKISGMVTEADFKNWKIEDFEPYVQHVLKIFGVDRCMFGSDWPVAPGLGVATYSQIYELAQTLLAHLSQADTDKIFGLNAIQFYGLDIHVE